MPKVLILFAILTALLTSGCVAGHLARKLTTEQVENAITLIKATNGKGCLCLSAYVAPAAGHVGTELAGTIGGVELEVCEKVCQGLRR